MKILVSAERDYFGPLAIMLYSLLYNNKQVDEIFLLTQGEASDIQQIDKVCSLFAVPLRVIRPALAEFEGAPGVDVHGPSMYYRLQADRLLPEYVDRILYLDADLIVRKNLQPLWNELPENCYLAAATLHPAMKDRAFTAQFGGRYFNSGVMVLNLKLWRRDGISASCARLLVENPEKIRNYDQCVLNHVCRPWHEVGITWNFNRSIDSRRAHWWGLTAAQFEAISADPAISHYIGQVKPWRQPRSEALWLENEYFRYQDMMEQAINGADLGGTVRSNPSRTSEPGEGGVGHLAQSGENRAAHRRKLKLRSTEDIFSDYYENNRWKTPESKSGPGSTLHYTAHLRERLPIVIREWGIRSMLDAPCGDFNWMKEVQFEEGFTYIGGDIVPKMVADNASKYPSATRSFRRFDVVADEFPDVDMWFCRDLLFHLPHALISAALRNFARSRVRFAMITSHINDGSIKNDDIATPGMFRLLDLRSSPYNLPPPLIDIKDYVGRYPPRNLSLWTREQIAAAIEGMRLSRSPSESAA